MCITGLLLAIGSGCGGGGDEPSDRAMAIAALSGDAAAGGSFFSAQCAVCHGPDAKGMSGLGSDLTETVPSLTDEEIAETFLNPPEGMTAFSNQSDQTLADLVAYLRTL